MICVLKKINYFLIKIIRSCKSFFSNPGLELEAALKKIQVKLELLTNIDMLLMAEKVIRGEIYHVIHRYEKASDKYMKDYE